MEDTNHVNRSGNPVMRKLLVIGLLVLALLLPMEMIKSLIAERSAGKQGAISEVGKMWGGEQTMTGPILSIPYRTVIANDKGERIPTVQYAHFLPEELNIHGSVTPQVRHRGIYEMILYNSDLHISATFGEMNFSGLGVPEDQILWDKAFVSLGIDPRGLKSGGDVVWNNSRYAVNSGLPSSPSRDTGISANIPVSGRRDRNSLTMDLSLNGCGQISFAPLGKTTRVELASSWKDPSFTGAFLPEERVINERGFSAVWKVLHLNRNYPQQWTGDNARVRESAFGVRFFYPVDDYQKAMRSAKYAVLFILLTFVAFFLAEVVTGRRLHQIQYLLVGFSICLFYVLLISISEHTAFRLAYFISSLAVTALIVFYTGSIMGKRMSVTVGGLLALLYGFLYVTLQLEDYALLMGSIGLFVILGAIMYLTRNIDWFNVHPLKQ
jgi:inner membrane protein